jgi:hypothetical protein
MYRNIFIKLVLKEIFKDPYLVNFIYNIFEDEEIYLLSLLHKIKSNKLREDIQLMYPDFMKSMIFENIRFDEEGDIDPGYTCYELRPLTDCGSITNYDLMPPFKLDLSNYNGYKGYNRLNLINNMRKKYSLTIYGRKKLEIIMNRLKFFTTHSTIKVSLWYDFENHIFKNI